MNIDFKKIKSAKWYRQETGSIPYLFFGPALGVCEYFKGKHVFFLYLKPRHMRGYYDEDFMFNKALNILQMHEKDSTYLKKAFTNWKKFCNKFEAEINEVRASNLTQISDKKILSLNKKIGILSCKYYQQPIFMDYFDPNAHLLINQALKAHNKVLPARKIEALLQPEQLLESQKYTLALLKLKKERKQTDKRINTIINQFYFITCSYENGSPLTKKIVEQNLSAIKGKNIDQQIKKLTTHTAAVRATKKKIYGQCHFNKNLKSLFSLFAFLTYWRDERKSTAQKYMFALQALGQDIARRSNQTWSEVARCIPQDIKEIPVSHKTLAYYKKLYKNHYLFTYNNAAKKNEFLDIKTSNKLMSIFEPKNSTMTTLTGQPANRGKVTGKARVILGEKDFKKFKHDDILVTVMTRPEFMPLMKKAKAFITDEGGITCHAAIMARELNKPCVIGTQNATRVLKDEDVIEVNAHKGVIKIVKKKL